MILPASGANLTNSSIRILRLSFFSQLAWAALMPLHADIFLNPNTDSNRVQKIAVVPFSDDALGHRHAGEWETVLLGNGYELVERGNIEGVLQEQKLSSTGLVNANQAAKIGALLGVDGIVLGRESAQKPFMGEGSNGINLVSVLMEPAPASVKLLDTRSGQVIWSFTPNNESEASPMVNPSDVPEYSGHLRKRLKAAGWKNFAPSDYQDKDKSRTGIRGIAALTVAAFSRNQKPVLNSRIAVYPFKVDTTGDNAGNLSGETLSDDIGNALIAAGYNVIERAQLEEILKDQKFSQTGAIRREDMAKIGEMAGIQGIVFGSAYGQSDRFGYAAKLVDVESGQLYWSAYGAVTFKPLSELLKKFLSRHGVVNAGTRSSFAK